MNIGNSVLVLVAGWLVLAGTGFYVTFVSQPRDLERIQKAEQLAGLKEAEMGSLMSEVAATREMADDAVRKWHARYKIVPDSLSSTAVVAYLNGLTSDGFKNFDVSLEGTQQHPDFKYYSFNVEGRGYYSSLYRFIWEVENNRFFYRVRDLNVERINLRDNEPTTGNERMRVMVGFTFVLDAYFGGREGLSAPEAVYASLGDAGQLPSVRAEDRPPVPASFLPAARPRGNPFFPSVLDELPPNTYNRMDAEDATLSAIVGSEAVFQQGEKVHRLAVGDKVYLGHVKSIDPKKDLVVVHLNKGGIVDEIEFGLHSGDHYRQALGPVQLAPITD